MAARKPDRRTERSRAALMSAFVEILLGEGYEALTVERVAERANVGRSTFYMHYTGKEDILRQSLTRPSSHLAVLVGRDVEPAALIAILEHFREQKKLNRVFSQLADPADLGEMPRRHDRAQAGAGLCASRAPGRRCPWA